METREIKKVAVLGAGTMGHGISQVVALAGYKVAMRGIREASLAKGMERIRWSLGELVKRKRITREEAEASYGRIRPTLSLEEAIRVCDYVIEAVPEDLKLKCVVLREADELASDHAILASTTSTLPITELAEATERPERVIGTHFFNPPQLMPLVEVIRGERTSDETLQITMELLRSLRKEVILCKKDVPGFTVNRMLGPILNEAAWTVFRKEATVLEVDSCFRYRLGLPMAPFELADYCGVDTVYSVSQEVAKRDPKSLLPCPLFKEYYEKGWYGQKVGRGFYEYKGGGYERPPIPREAGWQVDHKRILAPAINAAAWLLRNEVAVLEDIDKAVRLGLGFPQGLLQMADRWGLDTIVKILREKEKRHGSYYEPDPLLLQMVKEGGLGERSGRGFYHYGGEGAKAVLLKREPPIAWLTLNRPHRLNAVNRAMLEELDRAIDELWEDKEIIAVVVQGAGSNFSSGIELMDLAEADPSEALSLVTKLQAMINKLELIPKAVIAAIDGYALGGGCEIALACDFRLATDRAVMGQPEVRLGLIPGGGGAQRLVRTLGAAKAKEVVMLGERLTAEEACRIGLVNKVVPANSFEEEVRAFALKLSELPSVALAMAKYAINFSHHEPLSQRSEVLPFLLLFSDKDATEGILKRLGKKAAELKGE